MFGIGTTEFLVILLVAVLVLGPEHLPRMVRTFSRVMSEFRRVSTDFQRTMNLEADQEEMQRRQAALAAKKRKKKPTPPDDALCDTAAGAEGDAPQGAAVAAVQPVAPLAAEPQGPSDTPAGKPPGDELPKQGGRA